MSKIKQLQEQAGAKKKEIRAFLDSLTKDSKPLTGESEQRLKTLETEFDSINTQLEAETRQIHREASDHRQAADQLKDERIGLSDKEARRYSLLRAINLLASGKPVDGLEGECSQEEARRLGRDPSGFFAPMDVFAQARAEKRDMSVGSATNGGYLVGVDQDYANMVALLRNQSHVLGLGARVLTGLKNDVSIPRVLTGATAYWVSETGTITSSNATFGQIAMKPRRLGASVPYSKQFLAQSGIAVEMFVRDDVLGAFGVELDRVAINGAGASEPLGILNLATADRATSVTFGAAPTWAKVVSFETNVETANALGLPGGNYAYLTTPGVKGSWKTTAKVSNTASFLWENGDIVNGYAARSTNQVPSNKVVFGQFGQVIYGEWAGIDVTVDAITLATSGQVKVTIQKLVDMVIRQGKAFSVSADAGNQ